MSNENLNNLYWKKKLEDLDSLSGETIIDKNAAWEKLHIRLRKQPQRIKLVWYWAAACLLLLIIIPLVIVNKKSNSLVRNNLPELQQKNSVSGGTKSKTENAAVNISSSIEKKTQELFVKINDKKLYLNEIEKKEKSVAVDFDNNKIIQQAPVVSLPVIDSPSVTALAIPAVKKKLKVIHINELGDPIEEIPNLVRNSEHHSFEFKLINQEVYTSQPVPSNTSGFALFKSKIAPSN